jgi:hypothetical protein
VPWTATVMAGWRFGAEASSPRPRSGPGTAVPPTPAPIGIASPAPAPVIQVPRVKVVSHPDLTCDEDRVATGDPPPDGNEAWCVTVDPLTGRLVLDGAYIKWYDADHIEQRGQHAMDHRVGTWVHYDESGAIDTIGDYVDGLMSGTWRTYWPDGTARSEMRFENGRQTGESVDWGPDGRTCVVGQWMNGERDGVWREYVDGELVNERTYRDGLLMAEQRY